MENIHYTENIREALRNLFRVNESIFSSLISISMQGELKEWNEQVSIGEECQFDFDIFKNSDDINIQMLVKVMELVDEAYLSMINLNAINPETLHQVFDA